MLCFLEELLEESAKMSHKTGKSFLEEGIDELQDRLVAEDYNSKPISNLVVRVNADTSEAMTELVQIESKLEKINQLLEEINGKFKNENTIKIGVEVNGR
jgi:hypothetical protein